MGAVDLKKERVPSHSAPVKVFIVIVATGAVGDGSAPEPSVGAEAVGDDSTPVREARTEGGAAVGGSSAPCVEEDSAAPAAVVASNASTSTPTPRKPHRAEFAPLGPDAGAPPSLLPRGCMGLLSSSASKPARRRHQSSRYAPLAAVPMVPRDKASDSNPIPPRPSAARASMRCAAPDTLGHGPPGPLLPGTRSGQPAPP